MSEDSTLRAVEPLSLHSGLAVVSLKGKSVMPFMLSSVCPLYRSVLPVQGINQLLTADRAR